MRSSRAEQVLEREVDPEVAVAVGLVSAAGSTAVAPGPAAAAAETLNRVAGVDHHPSW